MDNLHLSVKLKVCVWFLNIRSIPLFKVLWQDHVTVLPHCVHTSLLADCANLWQRPQTHFFSIYTTSSCRPIYKTQRFSETLLLTTMPPKSSIERQDNKEATMFIHQARKLYTPTHHLLQAMEEFPSQNWQEQRKTKCGWNVEIWRTHLCSTNLIGSGNIVL